MLPMTKNNKDKKEVDNAERIVYTIEDLIKKFGKKT